MSDKLEVEAYVEYLKNRFPELNSEVLKVKGILDSIYYEAVIDKKPMFKVFLRYHGIHHPYGYEISKSWQCECINKIYELFGKQKYMTIDKIQEILKEYNIKCKIEKFKPEEENRYCNAYLVFNPDDSSIVKWHINTETNRAYSYDCYTSPKYHEYLMNIIKDMKQNINIIVNNIYIKNKNNISDGYRYYLSGVMKDLKLDVKK